MQKVTQSEQPLPTLLHRGAFYIELRGAPTLEDVPQSVEIVQFTRVGRGGLIDAQLYVQEGRVMEALSHPVFKLNDGTVLVFRDGVTVAAKVEKEGRFEHIWPEHCVRRVPDSLEEVFDACAAE